MVLGTSQARRTVLASRAGRAARRTACPCRPRTAERQEGRLPPAASPAAGQRWLCWPRAARGCGSALHPGTASSCPPCSPASSGGRAQDHCFQQAPPCRRHRTAPSSTRSSNPECVRTYLHPAPISRHETQRFVLSKAGGDVKIHLHDQERSQAIGCRSTPWIFRKEQR